MNSEDQSRKYRRLFVYGVTTLIMGLVVWQIFHSMRPIVLPTLLGVFFAYICRPLVQFKGSPLKKYMRAFLLIAGMTMSLYLGTKFIKESLPTEKEKLELSVRLQYRLNERYDSMMGLDREEEKGNSLYRLIGSEMEPLKKQFNEFISLTPVQRALFLKYRDGHKGEEPVSDRFFEYYKSNLKIIKEVESRRELASLAVDTDGPSGATVASTNKAENKNLQTFMRVFSVWLVFPLVFMFVLLDRGQILHFLVKLVPNKYFELTMNVIHQVDKALGQYIRGTILECGLVGATMILGLYICGVPLKISVMIGLIGGLTNAIPFVGTFIGFSIGAGYALIAEDITPLLPFINTNNLIFAVLLVIVIAQLLDNAVYQPLVVGGAVNIHPLVVILAVFGGSIAFGFAGLLLAIPTIVIFKVVTQTLFGGLRAYKII